jgi:hypothetical protein
MDYGALGPVQRVMIDADQTIIAESERDSQLAVERRVQNARGLGEGRCLMSSKESRGENPVQYSEMKKALGIADSADAVRSGKAEAVRSA